MSTTDLITQADEAEEKAAELRARADAERAEQERRQAEWQAARDEAEPQFWTEQRSGFLDRHRDQVDKAWKEFDAAVRAGKSAIAEWAAYREAVLWRRADKTEVDGWFLRRALAAYEQRSADARRLHASLQRVLVGTGSTAARTAGNMGIDLDQWRRMREEFLDDAGKVLGREFTRDDKGVLAALHALPDHVGNRPPTLGHGAAARHEVAPHGVRTYSEAVDRVTEAIAGEAVEQHQADRRTALTAWLDQHTGPAPRQG